MKVVQTILPKRHDNGAVEILFGMGVEPGKATHWTGMILSEGLTIHQLATRLEGYVYSLRLEAGE